MADPIEITVTKRDLVSKISNNLQVKQVLVKDVTQQFLDEIVAYLEKGDRIEFRDFGVFEVVTRKERIAQNPKTLEKVHVPARHVVKFKAGLIMKEHVRKNLEAKRNES